MVENFSKDNYEYL